MDGREQELIINRAIGARLRACRLRCGVTLGDLADVVGITYQQMHKCEVGGDRISAARLAICAGMLGVSVLEFYE